LNEKLQRDAYPNISISQGGGGIVVQNPKGERIILLPEGSSYSEILNIF
jgi:hypothetical protein